MADIHTAPRKPNYWPWVVIAIILLVLIAVGVGWFNEPEEDVVMVPVAPPPVSEAPTAEPDVRARELSAAEPEAGLPAVQEYASFAERPAQPGLAHEYTAGGIRRLADALGAIVQSDPARFEVVGSFEEELDSLRSRADQLQEDPQSLQHADLTRAAFLDAAALMGRMREAAGGAAADTATEAAAEIEAARQAAEAVKSDVPLLDQTAAVQDFFDRSASALRLLAPMG